MFVLVTVLAIVVAHVQTRVQPMVGGTRNEESADDERDEQDQAGDPHRAPRPRGMSIDVHKNMLAPGADSIKARPRIGPFGGREGLRIL